MKKSLFSLLFGLVLVLATMPSNASSPLQQIQATIDKPDILCGQFNQQKKLAGISKTVNSRGRFCIDRQKGILWRTIKPFSGILRLTRNEIIQYRGETVSMKLDAKQEPMVKIINELLFSLISGNFTQLDTSFKADGRIRQKKWNISLTSKNTALEKVIRKISVNGDIHIKDILIEEQTGDSTFIAFSHIRTGKAAMMPEDVVLYE